MSIQKALDSFGKIKVLHIDDDELFLDTIKLSIESINNNIKIDSQTDSSDIKNKIIEYDCVLLDYLMPGKDGLQIAAKIREFSEVPIILYTVQAMENISELIKSNYINAFIKKELNDIHYVILESQIINLANKYRYNKIYNKILDNVNDFIAIIDIDLNLCFYNNSFKNYLNGINFIGRSIIEIFESSYKTSIHDFLEKKENEKIDDIVINYNNDNRYVEIHKSKLSNESDYLFLVIKDTTVHSVQKEITYSSDVRFNALSKLSTDAILLTNRFGYVTYINQAFSDLTGFSYDEIVGKHVVSLPTLRGRNITSYLEMLKKFISGGLDNLEYDFPYTRKDGSSGIGNALAKILTVDGKKELISIIKDVTIQKQAEQEYQNIFKSSPDGIMHLDIDGNIKNVNESALKILGASESDFIGKNIFSLEMDLIDNKINFNEIHKKLISNKEIEPVIINFNINNELKWIEIKVSIIKSLEESLGIQLILRDITQEKEIENNRIAYTETLEQLVEERTNQIMDNEKMFTLAKVTSMIGHDLKGPLQVISNSIHLMRIRPENQEQYIEFIQKALKQSNALIEEMQQMGKEAPLNIEETTINSIIEETVAQIKTSDYIKFESIIKIDKPVNIDRSKFIRVFNNLFKNAIEAMPNGGKITFEATEKQDNFIFEIIDTGSGIPEDKLKNIFRPFHSSKAKGMGLGLTFCKNTVESHGGNISVESKLGEGTKFIIVIPKMI